MSCVYAQRTEVFEFGKRAGNSQSNLPTFQPFKLMYAMHLADMGFISQARKYVEAISKSVKDCGGSRKLPAPGGTC